MKKVQKSLKKCLTDHSKFHIMHTSTTKLISIFWSKLIMKLSYTHFVDMLHNIKKSAKGYFTGVEVLIGDSSDVFCENYFSLDDFSTDGNCVLFINEYVSVFKIDKETFGKFKKMEIKSEYIYYVGDKYVFVILEYNKHNVFIGSVKHYEYDKNYEYSKIYYSYLDSVFITIKNELIKG